MFFSENENNYRQIIIPSNSENHITISVHLDIFQIMQPYWLHFEWVTQRVKG